MIIKFMSCNLLSLLALDLKVGIVRTGLSSIIKFKFSNSDEVLAILLKSC